MSTSPNGTVDVSRLDTPVKKSRSSNFIAENDPLGRRLGRELSVATSQLSSPSTVDTSIPSSINSTSPSVADLSVKASIQAYSEYRFQDAKHHLRESTYHRLREDYHLADNPERFLESRAKTILEEAKTQPLEAWQTRAVLKHLSTDIEGSALRTSLTPDELIEAMKLMDKYDDQVELKSKLFRERVLLLGAVGCIAVAVWYFIASDLPMVKAFANISPDNNRSLLDYPMREAILLFALIGATVSSFRSSLNAIADNRVFITDYIADRWVLGARIITGVMLATLATTLVHTEFLALGTVTPILLITVAIVSGFSESFVFNAIDRMVNAYETQASR